MWSVGSKRLDVYLGRHTFMAEGDGHVHSETVDNLHEATETLKGWLDENPGRYVTHLWLSGSLARPFVVPATTGAKNSDERSAALKLLGVEATGLSIDLGSACSVEVSGNLGVVVENSTLDAILAALHPHRPKSIQPWWIAALNACVEANPAWDLIGIHDCDSLTVLQGDTQTYFMANTITPLTSKVAAIQAWDRSLMALERESASSAFLSLDPQQSASTESQAGAFKVPFATLVEVIR